MKMDLKNKVAVVTGAAQGLGRSFVEILMKNGSKVALVDMDKSLGEELKNTLEKEYGRGRAEFYSADVSSEDDFKGALNKIVETFGHIDIMCNNAGIINEKQWEKTIEINLAAVVRGTYLALEHMKKENGLGPFPMAPVYTATKHGVVGFSRAMAAVSKLSDYGVRINALCPWFVRTALLSTMSSDEQMKFSSLRGVTEMMMHQRGVLEVQDVAKAFLVLVKDEGKNGEVLMIEPEGAAFILLPEKSQDFPST
ncbi:hypothetical protein DNTS_004291, partial [Danionella cerebrum]